jgi:DNA (cytosine-5)-methyltransferase 1
MRSIELFAGAGGLAIGMSNAGFRHAAVVEWNHDACETFRENQRIHAHSVEGWPLHECDARTVDFRSIASGEIHVVSGGPPCQPFSLGGKHRGNTDSRDMFPHAVRAVRETKPKAFIFENVKGLLRKSFVDYFEYISLQLSHPSLTRRRSESWHEHRARLERHHTAAGSQAEYNVVSRLLNAADYGVPQHRERVFFVGFRADLGIKWSFPEPEYSLEALLRDQWVSGEYWRRHRVPPRHRPAAPQRLEKKLLSLTTPDVFGPQRPWRTVRDAISDLPPKNSRRQSSFSNHVFWPGARSYPGHTGSPWDLPAKTLKAGDHGVPGGENMLVNTDGSVRYFTIREAARLQTFPDDFVFCGSWSEAMRQLGNAVPVKLAEVVSRSVFDALALANKSAKNPLRVATN